MAGSATVGILRAVLTADTAEFKRQMAAASDEGRKFGEMLQKSVEPRQRAINAAVRDFLGTNEIRKAHEYAIAIEQIGGASKLTAADQGRVNRAVSEAIEHYRVMGTEAPKALLDLQANTQKASSTMDHMWGGLKSAAGLIGIAFSAGAVVNFAGKVFDAASNIKDQSTALGYTAEAFQRYSYAATQSGASQDDFVRGAGELNRRLAEGDKSTVAALTAAGLQYTQIRAMRPQDAFLAVADAVAKIEDPFTRANAGQDLFGKSFRALLPGMLEGIEKLGAATTVMSDETVDRLEAAQDAWDRLWQKVTIVSGESIGWFLKTMDYSDKLTAAVAANAKARGIAVDEERAAVSRMSRAQQDAYVAQHESLEKYKKLYGEWIHTAPAAKKATVDLTAATNKHADAIKRMADEFTGTALVAKVKDLAEAMAQAERRGGITGEQFIKIAKQARTLREEGAALSPVLADMASGLDAFEFGLRLANMTGQYVPAMIKKLGGEAKLGTPPVVALGEAVREFGLRMQWLDRIADSGKGPAAIRQIQGLGTVVKDLKQPSEESFSAIAQGVTNIAQVAGDEMPNFVRDVFTGITAIDGMRKAVDQMAKDGAASFSGFFTAATILYQLSQLIPTWMSEGQRRLRDEIENFGGSGLTEEQEIEKRIADLKRAATLVPTIGGTEMLKNIREALDYWQAKLDRIKEKNQEILDAQALAAKNLQEENEARDILQKAIEKYGFTIEELGPKWKQQRMSEQAKELVQDFTVLKASGIDVETVIARMGDEVNEFVRRSIKMGTEVPLEMKPMLEKMLEMGKLTDENGEKLEDLDDIKFGMTMSQGFQGVIDKLDILIKKITDELGRALSEITPPPPIPITFDVQAPVYPPGTVEGPQPNPNDPFNGFDPGNPDDQTPGLASGGVVSPRTGGTLVRLAEAGYPETVMPGDWSDLINGWLEQPTVGPMTAVGGDGASATYAVPEIVTKVYLDGKKIAEASTRYQGEAAARYRMWR